MLPVLIFAGICIAVGRAGRDRTPDPRPVGAVTDIVVSSREVGAEIAQPESRPSADSTELPVGPAENDRGIVGDGRQVVPIDRGVSRTRREHLHDLGNSDLTPVKNDYERQLDRYLTGAIVSLASAVVSIFYPPFLIVTLGAALYSTTLIFKNGYNAIVHERKLRMDVLGSLYFIGSYAGGFFVAGAFGLTAYYMSEKLVLRTQDRSQRSLIDIFGRQPRTAWLLVDGVEVEVPIETVQAGDVIVVQAGQVVPVDGVIIDGFATIDQHMLTGEGQPAEKDTGDRVLTATLMVGGKIHLEVEKTGEETAAAQIGTILNNTSSYQASIVSKGERIADRSVPPTMLLAVVAWPLSGYRYMVTILGSAIGLNVKITGPIAMLNFLNVAATNGILVKDGRSLELLQDIDTVVFDKTGTLTLDRPNLADIHVCAGCDADTVLTYAAAAEHRQTHPIAQAILDEAAERGLVVPEIDGASYQMGYGLSVRLNDHLIRVGSRRYMVLEEIEIPGEIERVDQISHQQGHALVMVAMDDELIGALELVPAIRSEARAVVQDLRDRNLDLYIISGDQEGPTREMAEALGISNYFANTLPADKSILIEQLQAEGRTVCFVGDGINDSIALKKAHVSISLRGASTAATDSAQLVLMGEGLQQLPFALDLAAEFDSNMKAGFAVAVGQGVIVIAGALMAVIGIIPGTVVWGAGLLAGLGIAQWPLRRHGTGAVATRRLELLAPKDGTGS